MRYMHGVGVNQFWAMHSTKVKGVVRRPQVVSNYLC